MRNALSNDERVVGEAISAGVIASVLKRKDDGVSGSFVCEVLAARGAEPVRTWRAGGRRVDGNGAYAVGLVAVAVDDLRECESKVFTVGASLSSDVLYEFAIGGEYNRGVWRIGCTYCERKRSLEPVLVERSDAPLVLRS